MNKQIDILQKDLDAITEQDMFALAQQFNEIEPSGADSNTGFINSILDFVVSNEMMMIFAGGTIAAITIFYTLHKIDFFNHSQSH